MEQDGYFDERVAAVYDDYKTDEGFTDTTRTVEKTIIIDQTIDGVPFIDPDAGHLHGF